MHSKEFDGNHDNLCCKVANRRFCLVALLGVFRLLPHKYICIVLLFNPLYTRLSVSNVRGYLMYILFDLMIFSTVPRSTFHDSTVINPCHRIFMCLEIRNCFLTEIVLHENVVDWRKGACVYLNLSAWLSGCPIQRPPPHPSTPQALIIKTTTT